MVGNLLSTRKHEVVFVTKEHEDWLRIPQAPASGAGGPSEAEHHEIEEDIIEHLTSLHEAWAEGNLSR